MENYNKDTKEIVLGWAILREKTLKSSNDRALSFLNKAFRLQQDRGPAADEGRAAAGSKP